MLNRRREFAARGPIPPWWRRPGVLAVVGLLVVGGTLASVEGVSGLLSSRQVRETTTAIRNMPLPSVLEEWQSACGMYGIRCAQTGEPPAEAVDAVGAVLREMGHDVDPARCGTEARVDPGTMLAAWPRQESQCTTTTSVPGGELTVAAWDYVPSQFMEGVEGLALGRTALVVEWDAAGADRLLVAEPGFGEARFADVRLTAEEVAALPGGLADAECIGHDADGCQGYRTEIEGPGDGRDLMAARARELLDAGFLVTSFECAADESLRFCTLSAERGREGGEATRIGVRIVLDSEVEGRASASVFTA